MFGVTCPQIALCRQIIIFDGITVAESVLIQPGLGKIQPAVKFRTFRAVHIIFRTHET